MAQMWEYENIRTEYILSKVGQGSGRPRLSNTQPSIKSMLNSMGKDGWELVGMSTHFSNMSKHPGPGGRSLNTFEQAFETEYVFKRPKED